MVPKHLGPLSQVMAREALLRGATQSVPSDWSSKREPSHIRQRYSGPVRLERIPAIPQKDVRISLDVPAPVVGGVLFVAALPASSAFVRAQCGSTLHRRVTECSEPSFEKDATQRTARTAASSSEPRANVHACFWMMRFCKRFAVTCRAKS
jgi:hypothetical protein